MDGGESRKSSATFFDQPTPSPCVMIAYQNARIKKKNTRQRARLVYNAAAAAAAPARTNEPKTKRKKLEQASSMTPDVAFALELAVVAGLALLIVAIVVASSGACDPATAGAAVHDVERALGPRTLVTYEQAKAALKSRRAAAATTEGKEEEEEAAAPTCCALCLSEYASGDELVRVVPACGHFFHAECGIDRWLQTRGTCPYCRAGLRPLPRTPRLECPPMPPRAGGGPALLGVF